jgi:PAS domain S-box-containing protein
MIARLLNTLGPLKGTILITGISIVSSVFLYVIIGIVSGEVSVRGIVISATIPGILAPLLSYPFLRMLVELHLSKKKFQRSEERFRELAELLPETIFEMDTEGNLSFVNHNAFKRFGYTQEEFESGLNAFDMLIPEDCPRAKHNAEKVMNGENIGLNEYTVLRKDGSTFPAMFRSAAIVNDDKPLGLRGFIIDITERKQTERALKEAYDIINKSPAVAFLWKNAEGWPVEFVSDNVEAVFAYTAEEFTSGKVSYDKTVHPDDLDRVAQEVSRYSEEARRTRFTHEPYRIVTKSGAVKWIDDKTYIRRDQHGTITHYQGIVEDITEQKQAEEEKRKLEAQLQEARRLEGIGTLAGGIAHDFNNLLMGIQGNVSLMLYPIDDTHPHYQSLKKIENHVRTGAKLTAQLLGYAREGKYQIKPISINQLVEETSEAFARGRKEITIHRELEVEPFTIVADKGQMEQVLLNLYVNASEAMPRGGQLILKTINTNHEDMKCQICNPRPGNYVLFSVTDTGVGIDEKTKERIFEPFFTTKEMGRGTGLGLACVYGIVKGHGGYIAVESQKDCGTTFYIYLPASGENSKQAICHTEKVTEGDGTILLVDDEKMILDIGVKILKILGYTVLEASGGREAVQVYKENKDKINLIILDMVMPDMDGDEAYDSIKMVSPDVKVLLSSGYSLDGQASQIIERGCDGFIQKPFDIEELSSKIGEILAKT